MNSTAPTDAFHEKFSGGDMHRKSGRVEDESFAPATEPPKISQKHTPGHPRDDEGDRRAPTSEVSLELLLRELPRPRLPVAGN